MTCTIRAAIGDKEAVKRAAEHLRIFIPFLLFILFWSSLHRGNAKAGASIKTEQFGATYVSNTTTWYDAKKLGSKCQAQKAMTFRCT